MASGVRCFLTLGLLAIVFRECQGIKRKNYVKLIKDVHKIYQTSSVFFIQSGTFEDLKLTTLMHDWSRTFSKMGVLSTALTFPSMNDTFEKYPNNIGQPLYVITLNGKHTTEEFSDVLSQVGVAISYATWLVIFLEAAGTRPHQDFCRYPSGNKFHLKFNTLMLVVCYDMPILREWYSMEDNITRTFDYATWNTEEERLDILTQLNLHSRRNNLFNKTLRIASLKSSTVVDIVDNELTGSFGMIFMELCKTLNFSMKILQPRDVYGSWSSTRKAWSGVIGQLANNEADVGLAGFTMTSKRMDVVDFGLPLIFTRNRIYIRRPDSTAVRWAGYFLAFDMRIWTTIVSLLLIVPLFLTWMKKNQPGASCRDRSMFTAMFETYTRVWGLYCQQGLSGGQFTNRDSMRVAYFAISISALIVYSAYSASLISYLTVFVPVMPFTTMEGFIEDGSYKLIVFKNSADSDLFKHAENNILSKMQRFMRDSGQLPTSAEEGFEQVCSEKVAFYTSAMVGLHTAHKRKCSTVYIKTGRVETITIALPKHSPYTDLINHHLQRFSDNGILNRFKGTQLKRKQDEVTNHPSVNLEGVAPILAVAFGGFLLSSMLLGFEVLHCWCRRKGRQELRRILRKSRCLGDKDFSQSVESVEAIDTWQRNRMEYLS